MLRRAICKCRILTTFRLLPCPGRWSTLLNERARRIAFRLNFGESLCAFVFLFDDRAQRKVLDTLCRGPARVLRRSKPRFHPFAGKQTLVSCSSLSPASASAKREYSNPGRIIAGSCVYFSMSRTAEHSGRAHTALRITRKLPIERCAKITRKSHILLYTEYRHTD